MPDKDNRDTIHPVLAVIPKTTEIPNFTAMIRLLVLLFSLAATQTLAAQDLFTVRVGLFRDVKIAEFAALKPQGFVYGIPAENNTTEVFVGHYNDQSKALSIAANLLEQGYRNAQAFALPVGITTPVSYVQFSLHSGSRPIEWSALERAGQLFVASTEGTTKIMTGPYPTPQAAASALSSIQSLGYRDAFVKTIDPARLIRIGTFETGIKKPLIPINLKDNTPAPQPQPTTQPTTSTVPTPPTYGSSAPAPAPATTAPPVPMPAPTTTYTPSPGLEAGPSINGKTKRHSAAELQRVLKEKGFYEGAIDGYYGPGTTTAFNQAWSSMPVLRKYKMLATMMPPEELGANWEETTILLAVANDMAAGTANGERAGQMLAQRRPLYAQNSVLTPAEATRVRNWAATVWTNLDDWATEDPLHAQIFSAFRVAYHQTQVRLENHYVNAGLGDTEATDLATAMLQNLLGAKLDRFL